MRALVDIPEQQIEALAAVCKTRKLSRAEAIRQAIAAYLANNKPPAGEAFGLWGERKLDGLAYQKRVRAEW